MQEVEQFLNPTDVIGLAVGANDGGAQVLNHGGGVTRINDGGIATIVDNPKVVVVERGNGMGGDFRNRGHTESAKIL